MATNKYVDEYLKQHKAAMDEEIDLRKNEAAHQLQLLEGQNKQDVADTNAAYETAFRQNEVQRILNERYLDRKAAEMGLSSSGMNLTQQTANQLSYGNQKAALTADKQRAIQTLAQTMNARKYEVESARDADIGAIKSGYNASAYDYATKMVDAENEAIKAQREAVKDNSASAAAAYKNLYSALENGAYDTYETNDVAQRIYDLFATYSNHLDSAQMDALLALAGISEKEFDDFAGTTTVGEDKALTYGSTGRYKQANYTKKLEGVLSHLKYADTLLDEDTAKQAETAIKSSLALDGAFDRNAGEMYYKVVVEKDTNSAGGRRDKVSIYYPDGTLVEGYENIKLKKLADDTKKTISNVINNDSDDVEKNGAKGMVAYIKLDLSDSAKK